MWSRAIPERKKKKSQAQRVDGKRQGTDKVTLRELWQRSGMRGQTNSGFLPRMHSWAPRKAVSVSCEDKDLPQPCSGGDQSGEAHDAMRAEPILGKETGSLLGGAFSPRVAKSCSSIGSPMGPTGQKQEASLHRVHLLFKGGM